MRVSTTIILCLLVCTLICYIVLERRVRGMLEFTTCSTQVIVPCSPLILSTKYHALFRVPKELRVGHGTVSLYATGHLRQQSTVLGTITGLGGDPIKAFQFSARDRFLVDSDTEFHADASLAGRVISLRIDTLNPGPHNTMSDIVASVTWRYKT